MPVDGPPEPNNTLSGGGNLDFDGAAGRGLVHRRHHTAYVWFESGPSRIPDYHDGDTSAREILLSANVLVRRHEHIEPSDLGCREEITVADRSPALLGGRSDVWCARCRRIGTGVP